MAISKETVEIYERIIGATQTIPESVQFALQVYQGMQQEIKKMYQLDQLLLKEPVEQGMTFGKDPINVDPADAKKILKNAADFSDKELNQFARSNQNTKDQYLNVEKGKGLDQDQDQDPDLGNQNRLT